MPFWYIKGTLIGNYGLDTKKEQRDYADQRLPPSALLLLEVQYRLVSLRQLI